MRSRYVYAFKHIITLVDKYLQQQGEAMSRKLLHEVRDVLKQSNAIEPSADATGDCEQQTAILQRPDRCR